MILIVIVTLIVIQILIVTLTVIVIQILILIVIVFLIVIVIVTQIFRGTVCANCQRSSASSSPWRRSASTTMGCVRCPRASATSRPSPTSTSGICILDRLQSQQTHTALLLCPGSCITVASFSALPVLISRLGIV